MRKSLNLTGFLQRLLLALFLLLLIWEWLKSLPAVTDTDEASLWMFFCPVLGMLGIYFLFPWPWIKPFFSLLFIIFWYHYTLWDGPFFSPAWGTETLMKLRDSLPFLMALRWEWIDPVLRTGLFYLLLWVAVDWLYREVIERRRILLLLFVSITYFSVLDTFFAFEGKWPVIKGFAYGLAMLSLAHLGKLERQNRFRIPAHQWALCIVLSSALILLAILAGYYSPKGGPSWPAPAAFLQTAKELPVANWGGRYGLSMAKTGYGTDDARLGGPFLQSEEEVMTASVTGEEYPRHYWRGESKEIYTGHGWITAGGEREVLPAAERIPYRLLDPSSGKEITEVVEARKGNQRILFTSGQPLRFAKIEPAFARNGGYGRERRLILANPSVFRFETDRPYGGYVAVSVIPVFSEEKLIELSEQLKDEKNPYPKEIAARYLQLPDTLPARVKHLTDKVVGSETNLYKKVKAVEHFLRTGGFRYETEDVPVPSENQDYVDQFLFESKRGYCDNFSTAMAVMLRTQGIPARWVKGYAFGELVTNEETEKGTVFTVSVREKDAHSWVEVYFPGLGWVPFEPTPGFLYPYEVETPAQEALPLPEYENNGRQNLEQLLKEVNEEVEKTEPSRPVKEEAQELAHLSGHGNWVLLSALLLLAGILLILFLFRRPLWLAVQDARVLRADGKGMVIKAYQILLKYLEKTVLPRKPGQTAREYASSLDLKQGKEELLQLTKLFEQARYGEKPPALSKMDFYMWWKEALKRLRAR